MKMQNVYGLAFHPTEKILYATHQTLGYDSLDVLFKINPQNGTIIDHGYGDKDYILLEQSMSWTLDQFPLKDVQSIAFQPSTSDFYVLYKRSFTHIAKSNSISGEIEYLINDISKLGVNGICFDVLNTMYTISGINFQPSILAQINGYRGTLEVLNDLPPTSNDVFSFLCMDCFKKVPKSFNCVDSMSLNFYNSPAFSFQAKTTILSNDEIRSFATYKAGEAIHLENHFEVLSTAKFNALIEGVCE